MVLGALVGWLVTVLLYPIAHRAEAVSRWIWRVQPVTAAVDRDPSIIWAGCPPWVGSSYWFAELPAGEPPAQCTDWWGWARAHGGVDAEQTTLKITVQAHQNVSLLLEGLRLIPVSHREVDGAGIVARCLTGGASMQPRRVVIDLDWQGVGSMTWYDADTMLEHAPSFTLSPGEIEQFHVWATARHGYHEWELELLMKINGRSHTQRINDDGRPFVTVGRTGLPNVSRDEEGWTAPVLEAG